MIELESAYQGCKVNVEIIGYSSNLISLEEYTIKSDISGRAGGLICDQP